MVDPTQFYRILPDLTGQELRWLARSIADTTDAPSQEVVENWSGWLFDKSLEDLTTNELIILVSRLKAEFEVRHVIGRDRQ